MTKTNTNNNNTTINPVTLQEFFEAYPNASIRKVAHATGINYGVLLKKSKEPIVGLPYDPEFTNWVALEEKLRSKDVDWTTLNWDEMNQGPSRSGSTLQKDISAFKVGDKVYLRRDNEVPYEILYKTETHIVIMKQGSTEPQAWANNTFLINGPVFEPRQTKMTKVQVEPQVADEVAQEEAPKAKSKSKAKVEQEA